MRAQRLGGSCEEIFNTFPADHYQLFSAAADSQEFMPVKNVNALPEKRFFLVALKRQ